MNYQQSDILKIDEAIKRGEEALRDGLRGHYPHACIVLSIYAKKMMPLLAPFHWKKNGMACWCSWNGCLVTGELNKENSLYHPTVIRLNTGGSITVRVFERMTVETMEDLCALAEEMAISAYINRVLKSSEDKP